MAALDELRLKKALATLKQTEQDVKNKQKWMTLLMSFKGEAIDARALLEISNKITRESMALEIVIKGLAAEAKSLSRSMPSLPPKQFTLSKFTPSSGGELKELSAVTSRMPQQMAELRTALEKFRAFATRKINDPLRTSDGLPMDPKGVFLALLDLIIKVKKL
jgi:hypothetical protein